MRLSNHLLLGLILAICLFAVAGHSAAQSSATSAADRAAQAAAQVQQTTPAPQAEKGGFFENLQAATQQLSHRFNNDIMSKLSAAGLSYSAHFRTAALSLAGTLALIYLLYESLMFLGSKNGSMLTVLFDVGIPAATAAMLITNYNANIAMFDELLNLLRTVAGDPTGKIMTFYGAILEMIGQAIKQSFSNFSVVDLFKLDATAIAGNILDALATIIFAIVILFIVFSSVAEVLGLLLLGPFLYAIAVAFGPFMLAGLVTPWTRDYVGKWLGFLIGSALVTGVLALIISIAVTVFNSLGFSDFVDGRATAMQLGMVAILMMAVNSLISQAPSIASSLIPGSIGAKTGGGGTVTKGVQKAGQQGGKAAAKNSGAWAGKKAANAAAAGKAKAVTAAVSAWRKFRP